MGGLSARLGGSPLYSKHHTMVWPKRKEAPAHFGSRGPSVARNPDVLAKILYRIPVYGNSGPSSAFFCGRLRRRNPGQPPFSSINSMSANSKARRILPSPLGFTHLWHYRLVANRPWACA